MANSLGLSAMLGNWAWTLASSGESWRVLRLLDKQGAGNHWHSEAGQWAVSFISQMAVQEVCQKTKTEMAKITINWLEEPK